MSANDSVPDPTAGIRGDEVSKFVVGTKQVETEGEGVSLSDLETR